MTRRERLENKAQKRREWAEKALRRSDAAYDASNRAIEGIPFGQPILVGHHSEKRHRGALNKCHRAMDKFCAERNLSKHHEQKADGLEAQLDRSVFSDDADAIEKIEARIAEREAQRERNNAINKIIRGKPRAECTDDKIAALRVLGLSETLARKCFEPDLCGRIGIPSYVNQNLGGNIASDRKRVEAIKVRQQRTQAADQAGGVLVQGTGEYVRVTFSEKPDREVLNAP